MSKNGTTFYLKPTGKSSTRRYRAGILEDILVIIAAIGIAAVVTVSLTNIGLWN